MSEITATPELLAQIAALVQSGQLGPLLNQNPARQGSTRQHDDLSIVPASQFDPMHPRQTFFIHDVPAYCKDNKKTSPYPKLLWSPEGVEAVARTEADHRRLEAQGYVVTAPHMDPETPEQRAQREFDALSPADQQFVRDHMERLRKDSLAELAAAMPTPQKRGPGRPKKVLA